MADASARFTAGGTAYGDISPRTAAFVVKDLLERGTPYLVFEKFGQAKPIPTKHSQSIKFRRYFLDSDFAVNFTPAEYFDQNGTGEIFNLTAKTLTEGVTPDPTKLESEDITAALTQFGDYVTISDVVMDTHEDPVLEEAKEIIGEQAAFLIEKVRFGVLVGGSNVYYSTGSARDAVVDKLSTGFQRKITRGLKRNLAKTITKVVRSTANYGTEAIAPSFVAICHPDCEADIRDMTGFVPAEKYGTMSAWENEIGKVEDVRYIASTVMQSFADAGGAKGTMLSTTGTSADVYPVLYLARDAYGIVPLKGKDSLTPMVVNPTPSDSDPLAQRGHVGWKAWQTAVILNDAWMARGEVAVSAL